MAELKMNTELSGARFETWDRCVAYALRAGQVSRRRVRVVRKKGAWYWGWALDQRPPRERAA